MIRHERFRRGDLRVARLIAMASGLPRASLSFQHPSK
jgi:hypothetical protein